MSTEDPLFQTIGDLRQLLAFAEGLGLDDDTVLIMASDAEGDRFAPLVDAGVGGVWVRPTEDGPGHIEHWDEDDVEDLGADRLDYEEWLDHWLGAGGKKCVILWPES